MATRLPAVFFGHGNPMNALDDNAYTRGWAALAAAMPRPRAILMISAHWYLPGTHVTAMPQPRTIHDFGGFPRELYEVRYPAPGSPDLAARVQELLAPVEVTRDERWGLDHGTWSVLVHAYPGADVPVVQLAIDETQPPAFHYALGKRLAPLRSEERRVGKECSNGWTEHHLQKNLNKRFEDGEGESLCIGVDRNEDRNVAAR